MNSTLRLFLNATDESQRDRLLEELILEEAIPPVRRTISYRLRFCLGGSGGVLLHPDAEDLCHDIVARLVRRLELLRARQDSVGIRDFGKYAARVAANACNDYLRQRYPARARLKDKLRDLLERHPDFAIWRREGVIDDFYCGFAVWRDVSPLNESSDRLQRIVTEEGVSHFSTGLYELKRRPLTGVVAELFNRAGGPVEFEALLVAMTDLLEIRGEAHTTLDDTQLTFGSRGGVSLAVYETRLERQEALREVWSAVKSLPLNLRSAFFFGFSDERGDDLLSLLLDGGVATPVEVAMELDLSTAGLMRIWKEMPLDNLAVAVFLGATRTQVSKWRYRAHRRLENQLVSVLTRK